MAAKDWTLLREALSRHVCEPLLRDHRDDCRNIQRDNRISYQYLQYLAKRGKISSTDDRAAILWYTLFYGCMHFDALSALIHFDKFQRLISNALNCPPKQTSHPHLLHVDFGCGPGTAAWAVIEALPKNVSLTTIGHDHNPNMIKAARSITGDVMGAINSIDYKSFIDSVDPEIFIDIDFSEILVEEDDFKGRIDFGFFSDWAGFAEEVMSRRSPEHCDVVLITVNSVFSQPCITSTDIDNIIKLIKMIRDFEDGVSIIAIGTHPDYGKDNIDSAWNKIVNILGECYQDGTISFKSWSPLRFTDYQLSDKKAWIPKVGSHSQRFHIITE